VSDELFQAVVGDEGAASDLYGLKNTALDQPPSRGVTRMSLIADISD
jgi:hypothetical protein